MTLVSVVLPVYNRVDVILRAVNSVLNQSLKDIELIIVDDNSADGTKAVIDNIKDVRVKKIFLPKNKGACYARNIGWRIAESEYIAFMDSDDFWEQSYLESQYNVYPTLGCDYGLRFTGYKYYKGDLIEYSRDIDGSMTGKYILRNLFRGNFISTQTMITRREVLKDVGGFDEQLEAFQDWDLAIRIAMKYKIAFGVERAVRVYESADSISNNSRKRISAISKIYEKYYGFLSSDKDLMSSFMYCYMSILRIHGYRINLLYVIKYVKYGILKVDFVKLLLIYVCDVFHGKRIPDWRML